MAASDVFFLLVLVGTTIVAARFGGRDERTAAFAVVAAALLSPVLIRHGFAGPEYGVVLVDGLLFAALLALAMGSRAFWPLWAAGFQLVALAVHVAAALVPHMLPAAYATTLAIWSYPVLASLALGTVVERRSTGWA